MTHTPEQSRVIVCSLQSERLLTLFQYHGFTAGRIGPYKLRVEESSVSEVRRFALFFHIPVLDASVPGGDGGQSRRVEVAVSSQYRPEDGCDVR